MAAVQEQEGVRINLISSRKLDDMTSEQKLAFILEEVRRGTVLVLERGLTAIEEINLIKATMSAIDQDTFIGIEMQSYSSEDIRRGSWLDKLLRRVRLPRMTVIGPADLLKTVHKDGSMVQAMILTGKQILSEPGEAPPLAKPVGELEEIMAEVPVDSEEVEGEPGEELDLESSEEPEPEEEGLEDIDEKVEDEE